MRAGLSLTNINLIVFDCVQNNRQLEKRKYFNSCSVAYSHTQLNSRAAIHLSQTVKTHQALVTPFVTLVGLAVKEHDPHPRHTREHHNTH